MDNSTRRLGKRWDVRIEQGNSILRRLLPNLDDTDPPTHLDYKFASLVVAPWDGATSLLVTFGGNGGGLMLPSAVHHVPAHVVAVRDPKRQFALCGIPSLGETYYECICSLLDIKTALGAKEVFCCGNSAGGYSALRYGLELDASGVMAFSAPTTLNIADDPGATTSKYPQLAALYRKLPDLQLDLAAQYKLVRPRPRAELFYSPSHGRDAWLAKRMMGIQGVNLREVPDEAGHLVMMWLERERTLEEHVSNLLKLRPVSEKLPGDCDIADSKRPGRNPDLWSQSY